MFFFAFWKHTLCSSEIVLAGTQSPLKHLLEATISKQYKLIASCIKNQDDSTITLFYFFLFFGPNNANTRPRQFIGAQEKKKKEELLLIRFLLSYEMEFMYMLIVLHSR